MAEVMAVNAGAAKAALTAEEGVVAASVVADVEGAAVETRVEAMAKGLAAVVTLVGAMEVA